MAEEDEALALELHKQLNAIPLRARRGHTHELAHQQSLDKLKRDKGSRPRSKRTNSSSQDLPNCKRQRTSDPEGHTSARQRLSDHDPNDSNHSQHEGSRQHLHAKETFDKHCNSRTHLAAQGQQLIVLSEPDCTQLLQEFTPAEAAAICASFQATQQLRRHRSPPSDDIKVFYAGARWALRLPRSAVKSRQQLAKALNDAFAGDITSVGQGEALTVVFVNSDGSLVEMGPTSWADRRRSSEQSAGWQLAVKTAARIYAR